eukprot:TRINITY_DN2457_c1_g1_i1.p1 TRINITY_DN2457_c1_g1~~TRINITY_DN2457_c1_g1_i1.p1  ORF type:complete len:1058 (+),score=209.68 TRINITY_DN2457_c1_g1_i1:54-3176(+)
MAPVKIPEREVPWCSLFLVVGAIICHSCVLVGNYKTASAMQVIGDSSAGWSRVGLGLSRSLRSELDVKMEELSEKLLDSLKEIPAVQNTMDTVLSLLGSAVDGPGTNASKDDGASMMLLQTSNGKAFPSPQHIELLQAGGIIQQLKGDNSSALVPILTDTLEDLVKDGVQLISSAVLKLWEKLKPTLERVGEWILKFGHKIQDAVDSFTTSMDKVQKMIDQLMSQLNGQGGNEEVMLEQTFNLFDVSGTGSVTVSDLESVSKLYSITALQGAKPQELVDKYDADGSGDLSRDEFALFVQDASVPKIMANVLRTYAQRLSEVSGIVAAAKQRDEVALGLVQYLELVCAKNMTKVGWVSDTLSNGSLPEEFTSAVMVQMCLRAENPDQLTDKDVGATIVGEMYKLQPQYTVKCANKVSDPDFWISEGFNLDSQPGCVETITGWITKARKHQVKASFIQSEADAECEVLEAMPAAARSLSAKRMHAHVASRLRAQAQKRGALYQTGAAQHLLDELLGGVPASSESALGSPAARAVAGGQPAAPETLEFAAWLAANASTNAGIFMDYCFEYSSESSTVTETFATKIKSMVNKVDSFIAMMMEYATPAGIQQLEDKLNNFTAFAEREVLKILKDKVEPFVVKTVPLVEEYALKAAHDVGEQIGTAISKQIVGPLSGALTNGLVSTVNATTGSAEVTALAAQAGNQLGVRIANMTEGVIDKKLGDLFENLVSEAINTTSQKLQEVNQQRNDEGEAAMLALKAKNFAKGPQVPSMEDLGGQFEQLSASLQSLTDLIPSASNILKNARAEVSKAAENMDSIFTTFETRGPAIFNNVAFYYRTAWTLYFFFLVPMTLGLLYYAFWASGNFGGPQPLSNESQNTESPASFGDHLRSCFSCCCTCFSQCHDTQLCLWSCVVFMQVIVLVIFAVTIVLCILAGVKAFLVSTCGSIYMLGDVKVCAGLLESLRSWMGTFHIEVPDEVLEPVCTEDSLLTCQLLSQKLGTSAVLTTVASIIATVLSLQMIIESARLHEMARYRRLFSEKAGSQK